MTKALAKPELTNHADDDAILASREQVAEVSRPVSPVDATMKALKRAAVKAQSPKTLIAAMENEPGPLPQILEKAFGVNGASFAAQLFSENSEFFCSSAAYAEQPKDDALLAGLEAIIGIAPKGPLQSMLAVQMLSVHNAAIKATRQAANGTSVEMVELYFNRSMKLMRMFTTQVELLARLQGKITSQKIVVEKVNVADGGQAIVGAIGAGSRAGDE